MKWKYGEKGKVKENKEKKKEKEERKGGEEVWRRKDRL